MRKFTFLVLVVCLALSTVASADVLREVWWGAGSIDDAIALAESGTPADQVDILVEPTWEGIGDSYTARMTGWLTVPADGEYTFYVAGDDNQRLWISQDDNPANGELVAFVTGWTASQDWTKEADNQKSAPMMLTEGQVMAFVGIMQEGGGGDGQDWGWMTPGSEEITVVPGELFVTEYEVTAAAKATLVSPADGITGIIDAYARAAAAARCSSTACPRRPSSSSPWESSAWPRNPTWRRLEKGAWSTSPKEAWRTTLFLTGTVKKEKGNPSH